MQLNTLLIAFQIIGAGFPHFGDKSAQTDNEVDHDNTDVTADIDTANEQILGTDKQA